MRFSSSTLALTFLFRLTLCDTVYYQGTSSVTTSTVTPIIYYNPSTLVSSAYSTSTEATATDYYTPPSYYTSPSYTTSEPTTTFPTTYILPTSEPPTSSYSTASYCPTETFSWTAPTDYPDLPEPTATCNPYRREKRVANELIAKRQRDWLQDIIDISEAIEDAKRAIERAIERGFILCVKWLIAILKKLALKNPKLRKWLLDRHLL
ncbi:hypothetical protein MFRU_036g00180 [Monilinia fructicola]|uniref:Uncharacterized protein n=1 Tax=Monilinia fructicola TaxID=38448 RepID=A0A5M9J8D1_MONFR|nr:hypothetical protein EYC84_011907 [Monilinia fructicola]KAG4026785.1 hypothetical protein MFRU_036g00180 [Monilinia fructicola]